MTITGRSPEHDLKATNDGDISNPPAHDPHSTGGINAPRSSHKTASRPSCPATDEHIVLHDGARIMTMPAIRSNPLIPSTSVSSHHGTQTHTVQTSQFHDSECKDADFDLSSTDSDHDDDDQLKNKGCYDRRVFSTDSNDDNSDDLKGTRLFSPKKENAHQKRASREVREAAEVNEETPRKRSRLNSGPNNDASDSAIGLGDESNHFSTRVEPAQIDAKHAWDKKKCMGEAADRVNKKELDVLLYVEASFAKEQDLEEGGLIDLVQEKKKKMREIEAQYDLHIAKQEHVVAQAAEAAQKCTDRVV